jgi:hypothetical protein
MKLPLIASISLSILSVGLTTRQSVLDNGLAQTIIEFSPKETQYAPKCKVVGKPLNLLIILDSSGSLKDKFEEERRVVADIIRTVALHPDYTRLALIQYSGIARTEFQFDTFKSRNHKVNEAAALEAVKHLRFINGITKTGHALEHAMGEFDREKGWRPGVPTIVFIVSDGRTYDSPRNLDEIAAAKIKGKGIPIWAYGTGQYVAIEELIDLTGDPKMVFSKSTQTQVKKNYKDMLKFFSDYKSEEVCEKAPVCVPGSDKPLDLLFVVDGSGSLRKRFDEEISFLRYIVGEVNVHPQAVRVAAIQWSNRPRSEFTFLDHQSAGAVQKAVDNIAYMSGTTNTKEALDFAVDQLKVDAGQRSGVPKVVVVLTDGHATKRVGAAAKRLRAASDYIYAVAVNDLNLVDGEELFHITNNWNTVFTKTNLTSFQSVLRKHYSFSCPGQNPEGKENYDPVVRSPVIVTCSRNQLRLSIRTRNLFEGRLYAVDHYDESGCFVRGERREREFELILNAGQCGIQRKLQPNGYSFSGAVMLQFHPNAVTKIDQLLDLSCFHKDTSARSKVGLLTSKLPQSCHYRLRKFAPNGCVALEARVGEGLYHTWECDNDPQQYGFLVHDCSIEGNKDGKIPISDSKGCPLDNTLFGVPKYRKHSKAVLEVPTFRLPQSTYLRFTCQISICDKAAGKCDHVVVSLIQIVVCLWLVLS